MRWKKDRVELLINSSDHRQMRKYACAAHLVLYYGVDRLACRTCFARLRTADSRFHRGGFKICKEDICKVLGKIYVDGG